jgi:hypothetical protein
MPRQGRPEGPRSSSFLLTVWRERAAGPWRAALRPADGGPRRGFADLGRLVAYLARLDDEPTTPAAPDPALPGAAAPAAEPSVATPGDGADDPA